MENDVLIHWGIKGMKWGVRRFQNKDGSLTPAGKKRYDDDASDESAEDYEARKQKALKSGSATDVLKFKGDLSAEQMQTAINRIRWEQDMAGLSAKEVTAGKSRVDKMFSDLDTFNNRASSVFKTWNTVANVVNAFNTNGVMLPKIDTNITSGNRADVKKEKEAAAKKKEEAAKSEQKKAEDDSSDKKSDDAGSSGKSDSKSEPKTKTESKRDEPLEGEVVGEGTSKRSQSRKSQVDDFVDVEFEDVVVSNVPAVVRNRGKRYVDKLLGLPAPKEDD